MATQAKFYEIEKDGPVIVWRFNNPPRNLATMETGEELGQLVDEFDKDPELRVGVVTSAVPGMFIQHFDVSTIVDWAEMLNKASEEEFTQMMAGMSSPRGIAEHTTKPLICAINGPVEGGGCELAMHCDFRFMARDTFMGQPEVSAGFPPGYGIPRMIQLIGLGRTLELCMSGRRVYPDEAERIGLVTRVCNPENLMDEVMKFALLLAEKPQMGLSLVKQAVYESADATFREGIDLNFKFFLDAIRGDEALGIMKAYVAAGQDREKLAEMFEELSETQEPEE